MNVKPALLPNDELLEWTTLERLVLTHSILRNPKTFITASRSMRQNQSIASFLSHKRSFFTSKNCAKEYVMLVEQITGTKLTTTPTIPDVPLTLKVENNLRKKRILDLESLIAHSNTKIKVIEDDMNSIRDCSDEDLYDLLDKMQFETDQQTENSEDTDMSDTGSYESYTIPASPSTESHSESETTDLSYDSDIDDAPLIIKLTPQKKEIKKTEKKPKKSISKPKTLKLNKYLNKSLSDNLMVICKFTWKHLDGRVFREPVSDTEAPGYSSVIKKPMDLSTIKKHIFANKYIDVKSFWNDMNQMFTNAEIYNETGSIIYLMAGRMRKLVKKEINLLEKAIKHQNNKKTSGGKNSLPKKRKRATLGKKQISIPHASNSHDFDKSPPLKRQKLT